MYCINCGTELPEEANFCWKCGYKQLRQTIQSSSEMAFAYPEHLHFQYDSIEEVKSNKSTFIEIGQDGKYGLLSDNGDTTYVPCKYEEIILLSDNFFLGRIDDNYDVFDLERKLFVINHAHRENIVLNNWNDIEFMEEKDSQKSYGAYFTAKSYRDKSILLKHLIGPLKQLKIARYNHYFYLIKYSGMSGLIHNGERVLPACFNAIDIIENPLALRITYCNFITEDYPFIEKEKPDSHEIGLCATVSNPSFPKTINVWIK